jgi:hypothetical protein
MLTLRHLVEEREGLYAAREDELPLLRYYANSIAHLAAASPDPAAPPGAAGASAEAAAGLAGGGEPKPGATAAVSTA